MSYLVLARKWRPQNFEDMVGQEHVTRTLQNAIDSDRVAHAYLFTGARGVGKTSAARIMAKALNCVDGPTITPCNSCGPCKEISAGSSVDIREIDGASNTSVDDIRELKESINYLPSVCRKKIYIIDEVHMLSTSAFNALLKTLEEPPAHVVFIFATTEPHKLPGTILSRCQRFDFKRIPLKLIFDRLKTIVDEEKVKISENGLTLIAREADGGMRDAQSLLDQVISFGGSEISDEEIVEVLGVIDRAFIEEAVKSIINRDSVACLTIVDKLFNYGWDVKEFGKELLEYFRNLAVVKVSSGDASLVESNPDELENMISTVQNVSMGDLHMFFDMMARGMEDVVRSFHPKISLEMLLLKMSTLGELRDIDELVSILKGSELKEAASPEKSVAPPQPVSQREYKREIAPPEVPAESPKEPYRVAEQSPPSTGTDWKGFVSFANGKNRLIGSMLERAHLIEFENGTIKLAPSNSFEFEKMQDESTQKLLKNLSKEFFGHEKSFDIQMLDKEVKSINSVYEKKKKIESDKSRKLKKEAMAHPMVLKSLAVFGGNVKEVITDTNFNE